MKLNKEVKKFLEQTLDHVCFRFEPKPKFKKLNIESQEEIYFISLGLVGFMLDEVDHSIDQRSRKKKEKKNEEKH